MKRLIFVLILIGWSQTVWGQGTPRTAGDFLERALRYYERDQYQQAIPDLTQAIRLDDKDENLYIIRGTAYMHQRNFDEALFDFNQAINLNPNNSLAYVNRSMLYSMNGDKTKLWQI